MTYTPNWKFLHDNWAQDFIFYKKQQDFFVLMARKHPGDKRWHNIIDNIKRLIRAEKKCYKKIYGEVFKITNLEKDTLIEWIYNSSHKLTDWEEGFLQDMLNQPWQLNDNQKKCLQKIYDKSTVGGVYQGRGRV